MTNTTSTRLQHKATVQFMIQQILFEKSHTCAKTNKFVFIFDILRHKSGN